MATELVVPRLAPRRSRAALARVVVGAAAGHATGIALVAIVLSRLGIGGLRDDYRYVRSAFVVAIAGACSSALLSQGRRPRASVLLVACVGGVVGGIATTSVPEGLRQSSTPWAAGLVVIVATTAPVVVLIAKAAGRWVPALCGAALGLAPALVVFWYVTVRVQRGDAALDALLFGSYGSLTPRDGLLAVAELTLIGVGAAVVELMATPSEPRAEPGGPDAVLR